VVISVGITAGFLVQFSLPGPLTIRSTPLAKR